MRRLLKIVGFVTATLILLVVVSSVAFYHLMRVGEVRRFLIDEIEARTQLRAELGAADLEIGWITGLGFRDLALSEPEAARPAITAERVTARLALLPLLRRQIVFYEIRAQRPAAQFMRDSNGRFPLLDKLLNLPLLKQQNSEFALDLRSLKIEDADIGLQDQGAKERFGQWRLVNADLDLERLRGQRLRALIADLLQRPPTTAEAVQEEDGRTLALVEHVEPDPVDAAQHVVHPRSRHRSHEDGRRCPAGGRRPDLRSRWSRACVPLRASREV